MTAQVITSRLEELGTLTDNEDVAIQRDGADLITEYFNAPYVVSMETTVLVLHYLTDIQVRDFALGLINPEKASQQLPILRHLLAEAPTDSPFINAPACLLSALYYEMEQLGNAFLTLSNAQENYSLALLLDRVFKAGWEPKSFAKMRKELHPKVVAGIYGEEA